MVVLLLSIQGQKALRFYKKYLHLCFEDEGFTGLKRREGENFHFWEYYPFNVSVIYTVKLQV